MTIQERIERGRLIEKIEKYEIYAKKLGIANYSKFGKKEELDYQDRK